MISIDERPPKVADRSVPGHWEGDLLMGKNHALCTQQYRGANNSHGDSCPVKSERCTRKAFARELKSLPQHMKLSLTYDRGKEMAQHELFTKDTTMKVYFCHPNSPWERCTNENTSILIRDFSPEGTDFSKLSCKEIKHVQLLLNERPRKSLNWKTPNVAFNLLLNSVALKT
jgi:IS30 family transposase